MRILIATTYRILGYALECTLCELPVQIDVARSPKEFADLANRNSYRLILTTFIAPFIAGDDLGHRLKESNHHPPAIFMIASLRSEQAVVSLYESGIDQYFTLPISLARIRRKVEHEIAKTIH